MNRFRIPVLGALALIACTTVAQASVTIEKPFQQSYPLKAGGTLEVSNTNGGITVEAWDRNEVHIEAEKQVRAGSDDQARKLMAQIRIDVTPGPSGLRIDTRMPKREDGGWLADLFNGGGVSMGVNYKVHVPRQSALAIVNSNGALQVTGTQGNAQLKTSNGGLTVQGVSGGLTLKTSNGHISVTRSEGAVKAETSNGGIDAELTRYSGDELSFETSNGSVSVRLPRDSRFTVDAATSNGSVQSDFPVEGAKPGRHSLKGAVNGGGPALYVRTSNGGVRIHEI